MKKLSYDIVIVGGGPAGLAAALEARKAGAEKVLICERGARLGGILEQCIHNGFGLQYFKEELTGPEYADRFAKQVEGSDIDVKLDTMVLELTPDKKVVAVNKEEGLLEIETKAAVLAMGCRERTRESITIPGDRPSGVMTAGSAQRYVNMNGYLPGKEIVILGSGDIGLIMARRLTLEGAHVKCVLEVMPYSTGLIRNKVQCLDDFGIPLYLNHTVTRVHGKHRLEGVSVAAVDEKRSPIPESEKFIPCDTLLLSVGLIPENELSKKVGLELDPVTRGPRADELRRTSADWIFACGNVLHVHDLVDNVTQEAETAGRAAAGYIKGQFAKRQHPITVSAGENVGYVVPQSIDFETAGEKNLKFYLRVRNPAEKVKLQVQDENGNVLASFRRDIVEPGSMIALPVPTQLLEKNPNKLLVSVTSQEGV